MCQKVSIPTHNSLDLVDMFCSLKFDSYIHLCGSGTFSGSCCVYLSYLRIEIGSFIPSCLDVLPIALSGVLGCLCGMSLVTLLCILRLLELGGISGFCPLLVCQSIFLSCVIGNISIS